MAEMLVVLCLAYVAYRLLLPTARYLDDRKHEGQ